MSAGGLDPYDDAHRLQIWLTFDDAEYESLKRMAKMAGVTKTQIVQAIMRDVIANEMADQGGALPQEQRVTKCA